MRYLFWGVLILSIFITGCTGIIDTPDPIIGHWGMREKGDYYSLDIYAGGHGRLSSGNLTVGRNLEGIEWEKNYEGNYTIAVRSPFFVTISKNEMIWNDRVFIRDFKG